jgi:hypothetical protein
MQDIQSILGADGYRASLVGFVGFDSVRAERRWRSSIALRDRRRS